MNIFFKIILRILFGVEAIFLLILAVSVLIFENILFLTTKYKRGDSKFIKKIDRFVESEINRGRGLLI